MRIAITHAYCWPEVRRGGERFIHMLAGALHRRGHSVTVISAGRSWGRSDEDGVEVLRLPRRRDGFAHEADFGRMLLPVLAARRFDAVHSMGRRDAVASIRAARLHPGRRTVFTDLGAPDLAWWKTKGTGELAAVQRVVDGIDVYSCMSEWALDHLSRDFDRHDGVVVPGGVSLSEFAPAEERSPVPAILMSGAVTEPRKGLSILLEALPVILESEPETELWISGPGDLGPFLDAAPESAAGRVRDLGVGSAEEQSGRYGRAWVTALPSVNDSFGMALIESLACGTPIVTSRSGAPQEFVTPGVTGEWADPLTPEQVAAACVRAIRLARNPETTGACRAAAEQFDWDLGLAPLCEALYSGQ